MEECAHVFHRALDLFDDGLRRELRFLLEEADADAVGGFRFAEEVLVEARHDAEERALACAVVPEHADLRAGEKGEPKALQDLAVRRMNLTDILHREDELVRHGPHYSESRPRRRTRQNAGDRATCGTNSVAMAKWIGWVAAALIAAAALVPLGDRLRLGKRAAPESGAIRFHVVVGIGVALVALLHTLAVLGALGSADIAIEAGMMSVRSGRRRRFFLLFAHVGIVGCSSANPSCGTDRRSVVRTSRRPSRSPLPLPCT